jgi:hypothetical protein
LTQISPSTIAAQSAAVWQAAVVRQAPAVHINPVGHGLVDEQTPQVFVVESQICGARQSCELEQPGSHVPELQISPAGQSPSPAHWAGGDPHELSSQTSPAGQSYFD